MMKRWVEYLDRLAEEDLVRETGYTAFQCRTAYQYLEASFEEIDPGWLAGGLQRRRYIAQQWVSRSTSAIMFLTFLANCLHQIEIAISPSDRNKLLGKIKDLLNMTDAGLTSSQPINGHLTELMVIAQFTQVFQPIELEPAVNQGFCDFALTHDRQTLYFEITRPYPDDLSAAQRAVSTLGDTVIKRVMRKGFRVKISLTFDFLPKRKQTDAIIKTVGDALRRMEHKQLSVDKVSFGMERHIAIRVRSIPVISRPEDLCGKGIDVGLWGPPDSFGGAVNFEYSFDHQALSTLLGDLLTEHLEKVVRRKKKKQLPKDRPSMVVLDLQDLRLSNLRLNPAYAVGLLSQLLSSRFQTLSGVAIFTDGKRYMNPTGVGHIRIIYNQDALEDYRLSNSFIATIEALSTKG